MLRQGMSLEGAVQWHRLGGRGRRNHHDVPCGGSFRSFFPVHRIRGRSQSPPAPTAIPCSGLVLATLMKEGGRGPFAASVG